VRLQSIPEKIVLILRPLSLLLAGVSLLITVSAGMALYAAQIERPGMRIQPSALNAVDSNCSYIARLYSSEAASNHENAGHWQTELMAFLGWGALSAVMFIWVYAALRKITSGSIRADH
jgi:hypothetical protein